MEATGSLENQLSCQLVDITRDCQAEAFQTYRQSEQTIDESALGPEDRPVATTEAMAEPPFSLDFSAVFSQPIPFDSLTFGRDLFSVFHFNIGLELDQPEVSDSGYASNSWTAGNVVLGSSTETKDGSTTSQGDGQKANTGVC
jgi:hypothetical protein